MAKRRWWFRAVVAAVFILIGWVAYVSSKQLERNRRIQAEISMLQTEAAKISRENKTLSERISYFATDDFREQEAKKKLGLKKTGETVVEVKPASPSLGGPSLGYGQGEEVSAGAERALPESDGNGKRANYKKWWKVFFGID